jgi:hypothetical protein
MRNSPREVFLGSRSGRGPCCGRRSQFTWSVGLALALRLFINPDARRRVKRFV